MTPPKFAPTTIPKTPMDAARANYAVDRMLTKMNRWKHYASEPVTDLDHARAKLAALASVMDAMSRDIIEKWDWMMIGKSPEEAFDYPDFTAIVDPDIAEDWDAPKPRRKPTP
jgi:hypothetical protein